MADQILNLKLVEEIEKHPCLYNYTLSSYSRKDMTEKAWNEIGDKVNLPGIECKERWKNLRAVFTRHMKPSKGSSGRFKKPYYLADAMQFATPFIKKLQHNNKINSENVTIQTEINEEIESEEEENPLAMNDIYQAPVSRSSVEYVSLSAGSPQPAPSPHSVPPLSPQSHSLTPPTYQPIQLKKRIKIHDEDDLEQTYVNSLRAKKNRHDEYTNLQDEANKMFLLSLLPDMKQMSSSQTRKFKRKVMDLIVDILEDTSNFNNCNNDHINASSSSPCQTNATTFQTNSSSHMDMSNELKFMKVEISEERSLAETT